MAQSTNPLPTIWTSISGLTTSSNFEQRLDSSGSWLPPRARGSNVPTVDQTAWYEYKDGQTADILDPVSLPRTHFKTYSFYYDDGRIFIYPSDATATQVGDGKGNPQLVSPDPDRISALNFDTNHDKDKTSMESGPHTTKALESRFTNLIAGIECVLCSIHRSVLAINDLVDLDNALLRLKFIRLDVLRSVKGNNPNQRDFQEVIDSTIEDALHASDALAGELTIQSSDPRGARHGSKLTELVDALQHEIKVLDRAADVSRLYESSVSHTSRLWSFQSSNRHSLYDYEDVELSGESDMSEDEPEVEFETSDWSELSFDWHNLQGRNMCHAMYRGEHASMGLRTPNQQALNELLPERYRSDRSQAKGLRLNYGLTGELPILIALICFSVPHTMLSAVLPHSLRYPYLPHKQQPGEGRINRRGLVISVWYEDDPGQGRASSNTDPTPAERIVAFELGRFGGFIV